MSRRAALSGLGFALYAVSRTALSFTLQGKHVSAGGQLRRQVVGHLRGPFPLALGVAFLVSYWR